MAAKHQPRGALEPLEQLFRPLAASRNIDFEIVLEPSLPPQMYTDPARLQQILKKTCCPTRSNSPTTAG